MSCCSELDWTQVNQTLTHHPNCREHGIPGIESCATATQITEIRKRHESQTKSTGVENNIAPASERESLELAIECVARFQRLFSNLCLLLQITPNLSQPEQSAMQAELAIYQLQRGDKPTEQRYNEVQALRNQVTYYQRKYDRLQFALPYWMGFLNDDNFLPALIAWINTHRNPEGIGDYSETQPYILKATTMHGASYLSLENSWRTQAEVTSSLECMIDEIEQALLNESNPNESLITKKQRILQKIAELRK